MPSTPPTARARTATCRRWRSVPFSPASAIRRCSRSPAATTTASPSRPTCWARVRDMDLDQKAFILVGVGPLASAKTAKWMRSNVPGVHIPDEVIKRLEGAQNQKAEGKKLCTEIIQQVRGIKGVAGVHVMAYR